MCAKCLCFHKINDSAYESHPIAAPAPAPATAATKIDATVNKSQKDRKSQIEGKMEIQMWSLVMGGIKLETVRFEFNGG